MSTQLLCPYCKQPVTYVIEGKTGSGSCVPCQITGGVYFLNETFTFWKVNTVMLMAGVGAQIEVNNGAGEMHPCHLRRSSPRWGYGVIVEEDEKYVVVEFEKPYFGRMRERLHRNSVRLAS